MAFRACCITLLLGCLGLLTGCDSTAEIKSAKAASYNHVATRLLVLADVGKEAADDLGVDLPAKMKAALAACGIESYVDIANDLTIGPKKIPMAAADQILTIKWKTAALFHGTGPVVQADYHLELTDMTLKSVVWKADMEFAPKPLTRDKAAVFSSTVLTRMKADSLLPASCSTTIT